MVTDLIEEQKKSIYLHMFHIGMIHLKLILAQPAYKLIFDKRRIYVSEFLHLIPTRLYTVEIDRSDFDFVNSMLRYFIQVYPDQSCSEYLSMMDAGVDLYDLVASEFEISWEFPPELRKATEERRSSRKLPLNVDAALEPEKLKSNG